MSSHEAKKRVADYLRQTLRTLRSGNDPEIAIAAGEVERDLGKLLHENTAAPLASARRRRPRQASASQP